MYVTMGKFLIATKTGLGDKAIPFSMYMLGNTIKQIIPQNEVRNHNAF